MTIHVTGIDEIPSGNESLHEMNERVAKVAERSEDGDLEELRLERIKLEGTIEELGQSEQEAERNIEGWHRTLKATRAKIKSAKSRLAARIRSISDLELDKLK